MDRIPYFVYREKSKISEIDWKSGKEKNRDK